MSFSGACPYGLPTAGRVGLSLLPLLATPQWHSLYPSRSPARRASHFLYPIDVLADAPFFVNLPKSAIASGQIVPYKTEFANPRTIKP